MSDIKWYYKPITVFLAILLAGPFAIPLVLMSPAFKKWQKLLIVAALVLFTLWFMKVSVDMYNALLKEYNDMKALLER